MAEHDEEGRWQLPFGPRAQLEVKAELGSVSLVPVEAGEAPWIEFSRGLPRAKRHMRVGRMFDFAAGHLHGLRQVRVRRAGEVVCVHAEGPLVGDMVLHVPGTGLEASVKTEVGGISIRDLHGCRLEVGTEAGHIELRQVSGALKVSSEAGSIEGRRLAGRLDVQSEAGMVRLEVLGLEPGEHRIESEAAGIHLELARGLPVRIETESEVGSVSVEYDEHPEATALLRVSTEAGSIRIREARTGDAAPWLPPSPPPPRAPLPPDRPAAPASVATAPTNPDLGMDLERILEMVQTGALSAREANELIRALGEE